MALKTGRPLKDIDGEMVRKLAAMGLIESEIGAVLGCHRSLIHRRFLAELEVGHEIRNSSLRRRQYEVAMDGNTGMLIWLGKQYLGQKDKTEHSSDDEHPFVVRTLADFYGGKLPSSSVSERKNV